MMNSRTVEELLSSYKKTLEETEMPDLFFIPVREYYWLAYPNCRYKPRIKGRPRKRKQK